MANVQEILKQLLNSPVYNQQPSLPARKNNQDAKSLLGEGATQKLSEAGVQNYDPTNQSKPYQEGVIKALKKLGEQHAVEAVQNGVSPLEIQNNEMMNGESNQFGGQSVNPQEILNQLIKSPEFQASRNDLSVQQNQVEQGQSLGNEQGSGFYRKPKLLEPKSMFTQSDITAEGDIQKGGFFNTGPSYSQLEVLQKLTGNQPLQSGEKEKALIEGNIELAKTNATNALSQYNAIVGQENKISEQYVRDFEPLKLASDALGKITSLYEDSLKNPNNNINDFFLVYNAIKAADPTAVKEGEYKTVQELMPFVGKILKLPNFIVKGETLTPAQRRRIMNAAVVQYNGLEKRFEPMAKQYSKKIKAYGGDPSRTLINYGLQGETAQSKNNKQNKVGKYTYQWQN